MLVFFFSSFFVFQVLLGKEKRGEGTDFGMLLVGPLDLLEAHVYCGETDGIDGLVGAGLEGVAGGACGAAGGNEIVATGAGFGDVGFGFFVYVLGDGLDAVGVVVGELGIGCDVGERVDAAVGYANCAEFDGFGFGVGKRAVDDLCAISLEFSEDGRGKVSAVLEEG